MVDIRRERMLVLKDFAFYLDVNMRYDFFLIYDGGIFLNVMYLRLILRFHDG